MGENRNHHLTIKIGANSCENGGITCLISPSLSISSNLNSPSPPSSAFVSALQSPYISPRASEPPLAETISVTASATNTSTTNTTTTTTTTTNTGTNTTTIASPISYASNSDDIPSSSCTPPFETFEQKHRLSDPLQPRVSFSFPIPRVSFTKGTTISSPSPNAKLRSCDVYIGYHGQNLNLVRFCKWLKSELEIQGIASFVADRAKYSDTQSHEIADRIICSSSFGVVVVTPSTFLNPLSIEEIRFFAQKKNLMPVLFDTDRSEIAKFFEERLDDDYEVLTKLNEFAKLEANDSNWRSCILKVVGILQAKLGRKSISEIKDVEDCYELPFHRNKHFVGREKELTEIEASFFGCSDILENESIKPASTSCGSNGSSDGFADEECDTITTNGKFISLEMKKCKEPTLEAWIEPVLVQRQRSKHKKSRTNSKSYGNGSMVCINGSPGIGKTELVVEYAYRYLQRYKKVLWVGGEARYFRQNLLNLSSCLGLDVSAESEKERGRIRSFEEQEMEAFQRVKRELFREVPYLLIIDNLETEKEWWEGKDLHDLIPRNTGATHVIITTRLSKVMSFDPIQLPPLSLSDSLSLLKAKKRKDYPEEEVEALKKFDERLGRLTYGLWLVGSLLSELFISPSALFEAIERICINESLMCDDGFSQNNPFLMKVLVFCFAVLDRAKGKNDLASRMVLAGAWFAPAPISSTLLANAADKLPVKGSSFQQWGKYCCISPQSRKNEIDSALVLVKLGLAKRTKKQPGCWIQLHLITQTFARRRGGFSPAKSTVQSLRKVGNVNMNSDHVWASAFLVFGFKSEPPIVQLKAVDMVVFIKKTALPLAIQAFMVYSRCNSALELLKVCTNVLEEVEKSFVSQIQDWNHGSLCWKKKLQSSTQRVDEYVWQDVTLLKATLLETRAKLLLRGGHFDSGEELCRTCISIRTVMLGHNHAQTLAAQETLAKLVRLRSKV